MLSELIIYTDRLKDGEKQQITAELPSNFMEIDEPALSFLDPVKIQGEAYPADDHLVLHLQIETSASLPCIVCNQALKIPIVIEDFYHAEALAEVKGGIFDYADKLREAVLLQTPNFVECENGNCPERSVVSKYLKPAPPTKSSSKDSPYFPFANLE